MPRFEIRTVRPIVIGGIEFGTDAVVGFLESDLPADEVLGSLRVNQLRHQAVEKGKPEPKATPTPEPKREPKPAAKKAATPLDREVLNDKVVKALESAGIKTLEQLRDEFDRGTDLTYLRGIGPKAVEELRAYAAK